MPHFTMNSVERGDAYALDLIKERSSNNCIKYHKLFLIPYKLKDPIDIL